MTSAQWRSFTLPDPISTNKLYRNVGATERYFMEQRGKRLPGRLPTAAYKAWKDEAILEIRRQLRPVPHCPGPFHFDMIIGGNVDTDNTLKCVLDTLKTVGLIVDDKPQYAVYQLVRYIEGHPCTVAIRPVGEWA